MSDFDRFIDRSLSEARTLARKKRQKIEQDETLAFNKASLKERRDLPFELRKRELFLEKLELENKNLREGRNRESFPRTMSEPNRNKLTFTQNRQINQDAQERLDHYYDENTGKYIDPATGQAMDEGQIKEAYGKSVMDFTRQYTGIDSTRQPSLDSGGFIKNVEGINRGQKTIIDPFGEIHTKAPSLSTMPSSTAADFEYPMRNFRGIISKSTPITTLDRRKKLKDKLRWD